MSNLASKVCRRILAVVLSIAMVMPNMAVTAYAAETSAAQTDETAVQDNDGDVQADDDASSGGGTSDDENTPPEGENTPPDDESETTGPTGASAKVVRTATLDVATLTAGEKAAGTVESVAGTVEGAAVEGDYFSVIYKASGKSNVQANAHTFDDGYAGTQRINFGGNMTVATKDDEKDTSAIKFTTEVDATVKVWWQGGGSGARYLRILNDKGEEAAVTTEQATSGSDYFISTMELFTGGVYYLGPTGGSSNIYKVEVKEIEGRKRTGWSDVAAPTIKVEAGESSITVTVTADVGVDGGDKVEVAMYDAAGEEVESKTSTVQQGEHIFEFKPEASGAYTFKAVLSRENEEEPLTSESTEAITFGKPLDAPTGLTVEDTSTDSAVSIKVTWNAVTEAEEYTITVKDTAASADAEPIITKEGITAGADDTSDTIKSVDIADTKLERGKTYKVSVSAKKGGVVGKAAEKTVTVGEDKQSTGGTYTLDVAEFTTGAKDAGAVETGIGTDGYFDVIYKASGNSNIQENAHTFDDGYEGKKRINFGGNMSLAKNDTEKNTNAIKFTAVNPTVKVTVWWQGGGSGTRYLRIFNSAGEEVTRTTEEATSGSEYFISKMTLNAEGTYYLGPTGGSSHIYKVEIVDGETVTPPANNNKYALDVAEFTTGAKDAGAVETGIGTDGYFDVIYKASGNSNIQENAHTFDDGYEGKKRINFGGNMSLAKNDTEKNTNAIKFTVANSTATVTVWWQGGGSGTRYLRIFNSAGEEVTRTTEEATSGSEYFISKMTLNAEGTYYLGPTGGSSHIYKVEVIDGEEGTSEPEVPGRGDWENIAAPEITDITVDGGSIKVTVKGVIDVEGAGADSVMIEVYNADHLTLDRPQMLNTKDKDGKWVPSSTFSKAKTKPDANGNHLTTLSYAPSGSGDYAFRAVLSRAEEKDENGSVTVSGGEKKSEYSTKSFKLPLNTPEVMTLMNLDAVGEKGGIKVSWNEVTEADYYIVYVKDASGKTLGEAKTEGTAAEVMGLTIGDTVYVTVIAYRENATGEPDKSDESAPKSVKITGEEPNAYIMDASDYDLGAMSAGKKLGTEDYYTLMLDSALKGTAEVKSASTGKFIEIAKYGSAGLTFTVYGTADASFTVASTGSSNLSAFGLVNSEGKLVEGAISGNANDTSKESKVYESDEATKGIAYIAYGTTTSVIDYKDLPAGTYTFLSPNAEINRGGRVHRAVVYDSGDMPYRGDWDPNAEKIGTPIISNIKYVKGEPTITVTASGYIGYYGADSLKVDMLGSDGEIKDTIIQAADSKTETKKVTDAEGKETEIIVSAGDVDLTYTFTPKASDHYSFRASLVRSGEIDIPMEKEEDAKWKIENFVLPLATPSVASMTNEASEKENSGSLNVAFVGVDEADYYVVTAFSADGIKLLETEYFDIEAYADKGDAESKLKYGSAKDENAAYEVTIKDLPQGDCYVTVQAFRKTDSKLNLKATTTTITRVVTAGEDGTQSVEIKSDTQETLDLKVEELKKSEENAGLSEDELKAKAKESLKTAIAPTDDDKGFAIATVRSKAYNPDASKYINGKNDTRWSYTVYGSNTTRSTYSRPAGLNAFDKEYDGTKNATVPANGYYEEVYKDGDNKGDLKSVTLWSENGRGKVVPNSTDGLSYYYTKIDPSANNFTLSALIHVKSWQYSNGQDGFGMMVSDVAGKDGDDGATWTNAYQLLASKIQYSWKRAADGEPGAVTNAPGNGTTVMRYEMKLGVGWNAKEGAKASDVAKIKAGTATAPANFLTSSGTLETSAGSQDNGVGLFTGSYNVIGNGYNESAIPTSSVAKKEDLLTDFRFQIQKYDNAYVLRYLAVNATAAEAQDANKKYIDNYEVLGEQVFSDDNNNKLTQIDKNNIYVGFFAARYARIGINDIKLNVTTAGEDKYTIPTVMVDPSVTISSMEASNSENYDLILNANFDGTLTVYKVEENGAKTAVTTGKAITAGTKYAFTTKLKEGKTKFIYYATPNASYVPGENQALSNFDTLTNEKLPLEVTYHAFAGDTIYVAPNGAYVGTPYTVTEDGVETTYYAGETAKYPTNVYDAVNYAKAGDTIILAGGMYDLTTDAYSIVNNKGENVAANLLVGKKHDGTAKSYITMRAADDAVDNGTTNNRPVLNFGQNTQKNDTAFTIAGNYWRFEGFDVMGSKDGQKGIQLSGSHNILKNLRTYMNGNTGVQVARYGSDGRADWPSYNTLLNCSSFMNYDAGYEDADGYAAKLTCGDGNKFIGCIAAFNADDGWDLFAKVETGSIGVVTIENCLAFKNGYLFGEEDYYGSGSDLIYRYTDFSRFTKNTHLVNAGNGNGFKMGGDSMSGYHVLKNSVAFGNKSKGIDSNSCPDIQIYNSISFNNEANNVALYTGGAVNTDFYVENLISIKDSSCSGYSTTENFDLRGTQNIKKVKRTGNYFWTGSKSVDADGNVFDPSRFGHMSINTAIFGGANAISRDADGSINLHGFLEVDGASIVGGTNEEDSLDLGADIYVFAAEYCKSGQTLADISLNGAGANDAAKKLHEDGYKWADGADEILTASYAGSSVDFKVTNGKNEKTVTVNFIQLDGAELQVVSGDDNNNGVLEAKETWTVEAVPVISPAVEPDVKLSGFSAEIKETTRSLVTLGTAAAGTVNENLSVSGANVTAKGSGSNGDVKLTALVTLSAGGKTVKQTATLEFAVKNEDSIKFDSITPDDTAKVKWDKESDSDYIQVSMDAGEFTMKNLRIDKGDSSKGIKIAVNDTSVIKLNGASKISSGGDVSFKVVNKSGDGGTATVTVTSAADKTLVRNYIVTVSGSEFAWTAGTIEIDKAKTAGVQLTAVAPFDYPTQTAGNIENITVAKVYKGAKASGNSSGNESHFTAIKVAGSVYELNTTKDAVSGLPKGIYTVVYQAEVPKFTTNEDGSTTATSEKEKVEFTPITIKVIETRPVVTFKQTKKVNLFYNNGTDGSTGKLVATSKQGAVTVTASGNDKFKFADNGSGYDIVCNEKNRVTLTANGAADYKALRQNSKIPTLTAHVDGYYDSYDVEKRNFAIALEYRQPKLKLTALDKTIYTEIGMDSADILVYDPDSEMYLSTETATIELVTDSTKRKAYSKANADFTVGEITEGANQGNGVRLTVASSAAKGGTVKLSIKYDDWFGADSVIVSQSVRVATTMPRLTIKPVKLNINNDKDNGLVGKEQASAAIVLTGAADFMINDVTLEGSNDKATAFLNFVDYESTTDINGNKVLLVSLKANGKDGNPFPSTGTPRNDGKMVYKMNSGYANSYSYKVNYKLGDKPQTTTFRLSLVNNEKLAVSTKGSINLIDRVNSTVTLKPKTTNFTPSQVAGVALTGDAASLFTITEFDKNTGVMTVKAKDTADLKKGSYKVTPEYTFDLGVQGTFKLKTERPITISTKQSALKISGLKDALEVKLSKPDAAAQRTLDIRPAGAYITNMTQISSVNNFTLTYTGDGVQVAIKNRAGLKEGKTYKIVAIVTVEGSGSNVKKQLITVPVRVIR